MRSFESGFMITATILLAFLVALIIINLWPENQVGFFCEECDDDGHDWLCLSCHKCIEHCDCEGDDHPEDMAA